MIAHAISVSVQEHARELERRVRHSQEAHARKIGRAVAKLLKERNNGRFDLGYALSWLEVYAVRPELFAEAIVECKRVMGVRP